MAAAPQRLPDFLVLGTQKGGTTSLQQLLGHHPEVFLAAGKEVHYFSLHHDQPLSWYAAHYATAAADQRCGDITPFYLFHPEIPGRIRALLPQVKLIALLRDPVERALSQVFHARRLGFEPLEPAEALAAEPARLASGDPFSLQKHSYVARSRYLEQLQRYEALFPAKRTFDRQARLLARHRGAAIIRLRVLPARASGQHKRAGQICGIRYPHRHGARTWRRDG